MSDLMKVGADWGGPGTFKPLTSGISGAQRVTDAHAKYMDAILSGRVFMMSVGGATATAYTGGAGGTPLLAIHNPANSQKYAVPLFATFGGRVAASGAGTVAFELYGGVSVLPTGTVTAPRSVLSLVASGSSMVGFSNTALTGSTALTLLAELGTYYWATAAAAFMAPGYVDLGGLGVVAPGNELAFGATAALASATWSATLFWEEVPYLVTV